MNIIESSYYISLFACVILGILLLLYYNKFRLKLQKLELELLNKTKELEIEQNNSKNLTEKLQNLESNILNTNENHKNELLEMQENCNIKISQITSQILKEQEEKLKDALISQEQKLDSIHTQKKLELKEILNTEREAQIALMTQKFNDLSKNILDEKSKAFNQKQEDSLKPLLTQISLFKQEIEKNTKDSAEKQVRLQEELKTLNNANAQLSKDANALANALKGDNKMQGIWGEIILERLLELSGLKKGFEYRTQQNIKVDTKNMRPDVIVELPGDRCVVIDSKVSLSAYERYVNGGGKGDLSAHIESVKSHIKTLQSKEYHNIIRSSGEKIDFVIMFMPIEGAFSAIMSESIFEEGYKRGVMLATPSTLMVILRLIENIWSNEAKDKNLSKILAECEKLIKKFDLFSQNMEKIKVSLDKATQGYDDAKSQLITGRGAMGNILGNIKEYMKKIETPIESNLLES